MNKVAKWTGNNPSQRGDFNSVAISADGSKVVGGTFYFNDDGLIPSETTGMFAWDGNGTQLWQDTDQVSAIPDWRAGVESVAIAKNGTWSASGGLIEPSVGFVHVYDAAGNKTSLLTPTRAVTAVALSGDGKYLVAGADVLYVFKRTGNTWAAPVTVADPPGVVRRVAISDDGQWIATSIDNGWTSLVRNQLATGGAVTLVGKWKIPVLKKYVQHIAMAGDGSAYAAAGADGKLYYFDIAATVQSGALTPRWDHSGSGSGSGKTTCRWAAMSQDGSHVSAAFSFDPNPAPNTRQRGKVDFLRNVKNPGPGGQKFEKVWTGNKDTAFSPNAISLGQKANGNYYIGAADGMQLTAGGFYLFDGANGNSMWGSPPHHNFPTTDMNYTVAMSADGTGVVGGSNDGHVYYFVVP